MHCPGSPQRHACSSRPLRLLSDFWLLNPVTAVASDTARPPAQTMPIAPADPTVMDRPRARFEHCTAADRLGFGRAPAPNTSIRKRRQVGRPPSFRRKRVARAQVARFEPAAQPIDPLFAGAVRECLRHHITLSLLLQAIVADRGGRLQSLFEIARFDELPVRALCIIRHTPAKQSACSSIHTDNWLARASLACRRAASTLSEMPSRFWT